MGWSETDNEGEGGRGWRVCFDRVGVSWLRRGKDLTSVWLYDCVRLLLGH